MRNFLFFFMFLAFGCKKLEAPIAPADLTATVVSTTEVNLSWTDKSAKEAGFKIQRKTGNAGFTDVGTTATNVTTYSDKNLTPNVTYTYRVYAFNSAGVSMEYTNEVTVTTWGLPTLTTTAVTAINHNSAKSGGNITNDGGLTITARGVVWGTSPNPTVSLATKTTDATGAGSFTSNITGIAQNTTYYVRAYAVNTAGTSYGDELTFTTTSAGSQFNSSLTYGNLTDIEGVNYKTIVIGDFIWMAENLKTTKYSNGTSIPNISDNLQWQSTSNGAWSYLNGSDVNNLLFGKLYNWYAVNNSNGLCPTGWTIPTKSNWISTINFLGGAGVAGGNMKSTGTGFWLSPNIGAKNESGFSGMPGGFRNSSGAYDEIGKNGQWWGLDQTDLNNANAVSLNYNLSSITSSSENKRSGYSVRCIKGNFDKLLGSYPNTTEDFGGSKYGPYTTSINKISTTGLTCEIEVSGIYNKAWKPIKFLLDLSDYSVKLTQQSGIGDGGTLNAAYSGRDISVRPDPTKGNGTFSLVDRKIILRLQVGITGLGWFSASYEVVMQ